MPLRLLPFVLAGALLTGCAVAPPLAAARDAGAVRAAAAGSWVARLKTHDDVLAYLVAHREDFSLAAYRLDAPEAAILHQPDVVQALASTCKIMVLHGYAKAVADGRLAPDERVALADVEAYYLAGSDGDAHPQAVAALRTRGAIDDAGRIALDDVVGAMMAFSDNAATDYTIERVGRPAMEAVPAALGLEAGEAPFPLIGGIAAWLAFGLDGGRAALADRAYATAAALRREPAARQRLKVAWAAVQADPRYTEAYMARQAEISPTGTARGYARVMAEVVRPTAMPAAVAKVMRRHLEWQLADPKVAEGFLALGYKGGSLPGVLTSGWFAQLKAQPAPAVSSLFFRRLPMPVWEHLSQTGLQQQFELVLMCNPGFFAKARQVLADPAAR